MQETASYTLLLYFTMVCLKFSGAQNVCLVRGRALLAVEVEKWRQELVVVQVVQTDLIFHIEKLSLDTTKRQLNLRRNVGSLCYFNL
jgi:hypothetical protein